MKVIPFALLLALPLVLTAAEVRPGDTVREVRAALGAPNGELHKGDRHLLYYDRGEVELRSGSVIRVALLSNADFATLEVRRAQVREEQEARRARLSAEGEALKARVLADPSFLVAPLSYQVAFWENFSRRYPGVIGAEPLLIARLRLAEQRRTQIEQEQRLADLEARVIEAESRANEAALYRRNADYSYGGGYARHPFTLWPVEYHFADGPPTASPRAVPAVDTHSRLAPRAADRLNSSPRSGPFNPDYDLARRPDMGGMRFRL